MFFVTGIIIAAVFFFSISIPFLSWVLPFYKIKKLENADMRTKIIVNITALIAIAIVDVGLLIVYVGVFCTIEFLYYMFKRYSIALGEFDKIFIISLLVGSLACAYIFFNRADLSVGLEALKKMYIQNNRLTQSEIDMVFKFMKENFVYLIFMYMILTVFLTNYFLNRKSFVSWNVSYLWLVPYVIFFFIEKYTQFSGVFISNILEVLKIIYIIYFVRIVAEILSMKMKKESLCFTIGVLLALMSPGFAFVFGGLASGIKIKIIK